LVQVVTTEIRKVTKYEEPVFYVPEDGHKAGQNT